ncbi:MAG: glycosyltransferase family 39 protein [Putridiphycobacter sp.]|nr:glycosyltransferase family 39 protein [Putridiphycobacter sp.]
MEITDRKIIWGLIVLQLIVCLPFINSFPIALDEPFSIFYAQQEIGEFIPFLNSGNNSPLYFIMLHFWIDLFGISATAVRSLSLIFSLITLFILFRISRKVLSLELSSLVSLLFIFSSFFHYHSMEARMYMLFSLFFLLIINEVFEIVFGSRRNLFFLVTFNVLLFYCHYLSLFVFASEIIVLAYFYKSIRTKFKKIGLAAILTIVLIAPGLMILYNRIANAQPGESWVPEPEYSELYGNVIRFFNNKYSFLVILIIFLTAIFVNKIKLKEFIWSILSDKVIAFYACFFGVPYLLMFIFSFSGPPVFLDRYILFTSLPLFLIVAHILKHTFKNLILYSVLIVIPMAITTEYKPDNNRSINLIVNEIKDKESNVDFFYISPPWLVNTFLYHYDIEEFKDYKNENLQSVIQPLSSVEEIQKGESIAILVSEEGWLTLAQIRNFAFRNKYVEDYSKTYNNVYHFLKFSKHD